MIINGVIISKNRNIIEMRLKILKDLVYQKLKKQMVYQMLKNMDQV